MPEISSATAETVMRLENGLALYLPDPRMLGIARVCENEVFRDRRYCRTGFEIRPGDTVVDVGANIGMFTLWAAPLCRPGRLLAVEPSPVCEVLRDNVERNGLDNVVVVPAALGEDGVELELVYYPGLNGLTHASDMSQSRLGQWVLHWFVDRDRRPATKIRVPCQSLGTLLDEAGIQRVDYLKLDCEGGEYGILETLREEDWNRIDKIAMEFHELNSSQRVARLTRLLEQQGFRTLVRKPLWSYYMFHAGELWAWRE